MSVADSDNVDPRIDRNEDGEDLPGGWDSRGSEDVEPDPADMPVDEEPGWPALGDMERELDQQRDRFLRLAAEYDNYRKRTAKERIEAESRGQASLVKELLDPLDDLARFANIDPGSVDTATIVEGVVMVEKKLQKALDALGLEVVDPVDQPFDPTLHEAVATERALSAEDDHLVARVYQQGYVFNGQLLRPARVVVKQWTG